MVMPGAQRVIEYHVIAEGGGWARAHGHAPIRLRQGDLLLYPQGDSHVLSSAPDLAATRDLSVFSRPEAATLPLAYARNGGGDEHTRIVCSFMGLDERPYNPLLTALPSVIHLSSNEADAASGWLGAVMRVAVSEARADRPGGENVLARLAEVMFVEAIRRYLETLPPSQMGWLSGLRDPVVGQALAAMHAEPRRAWTVEDLAHLVGQSRSVFAEQFTEMVGQPPMQYLALWRMQLASHLLSDGQSVVRAADAVGYESEAAFSRAFKKLVGEPPATWRGKHRA
jgi:AraC-like DNA-binding protein